jgi:hypothetical protein
MLTEYEKRYQERNVIKKETRNTIFISLACLVSVGIYTLIANLIKTKPMFTPDVLDKILSVANLFIVLLAIVILAMRKTIYYSPRFVKEDFTLIQVLQTWVKMDVIMLAVAEVIPILGLMLRFFGIPLKFTWVYFVAGGILMILIMPVGIKVRSKLTILRKTHTNI